MKKIALIILALFVSSALMAGVITTQPIEQVIAGNTQVGILGKTVSPQAIAFIDTGQKATLVADNSVMKKSTGSSSKAYLIKANDVARVENSTSGAAGTLVLASNFASDTIKLSVITDYGRDKFEVGWVEGQSKIDSKQTV